MIIKRFKAENFRNIGRCDIEFSPGVNLLYGKNAQGKTTLLEAVYLLTGVKSESDFKLACALVAAYSRYDRLEGNIMLNVGEGPRPYGREQFKRYQIC